MRKYILNVFSLAVLAAAVMAVLSLRPYFDIVTVKINRDITAHETDNLVGYDIMNYSVLRRIEGIVLNAGYWSNSSASIYQCTNEFNQIFPHKMLYGQFSVGGTNIVIDSEIAWRYFSRTDCVGGTITVAGRDYIVSGVYKKPGLLSLVTSRESYILYTGIEFEETAGETEIILKCGAGLAPIVLSKLNSPNCERQVNIDAIARGGLFWSLLFILIAVAVFVCKILKSVDIKNLYSFRNLIHALIFTGAIALCVIIIANLRFLPDPRRIPDNLIDMEGIMQKIQFWYNGINNGVFSGGTLYAGVTFLSNLAKILSLMLLGLTIAADSPYSVHSLNG